MFIRRTSNLKHFKCKFLFISDIILPLSVDHHITSLILINEPPEVFIFGRCELKPPLHNKSQQNNVTANRCSLVTFKNLYY
jgi:hypothetical protein